MPAREKKSTKPLSLEFTLGTVIALLNFALDQADVHILLITWLSILACPVLFIDGFRRTEMATRWGMKSFKFRLVCGFIAIVFVAVGAYVYVQHAMPKELAKAITPRLDYVAQYDSLPHIGPDDSGFLWNKDYLAVFFSIKNSGESSIQNLTAYLAMPNPITVPSVSLLETLPGCSAKLIAVPPGIGTPAIIAGGAVFESPSMGLESSVVEVRCQVLERGQAVVVKMASRDGCGLDGKIKNPGKQEIPEAIEISGGLDSLTSNSLKRFTIGPQQIRVKKRL